ncbi:hypothetical protein QAD02_014883 [Eretmocerus hayati]|uniref:Uncharacterized protein n=1 Tax=Eretmocerus hayati TaxID=131215 RepID=A0ACC2P7Z5_9HYME|nr:hypothetical protein QAD02_014883 [Eretmocerus hayati]
MYPKSRINRVHATQQGRPIRGDSSPKPSTPIGARVTPTLGDFSMCDGRLTLRSEAQLPSARTPLHSKLVEPTIPAALGRAPSASSLGSDQPLDLSLCDFPPLRSYNQDVGRPPMTDMPVDANLMLLQAIQREEDFLNSHFPNRKRRVIKASELWSHENINNPVQKPGTHLSATATAWYPTPIANVTNSDPWRNLGDNPIAWPEEILEQPIVLQGEDRVIVRPPLGTLPPQSPWPNTRPQFGLAQFMKVKLPTDDKDYRMTIKPAFHGYFDQDTNKMMNDCTCVHTCIWTPPDGSFWLCETCYKGGNMNWNLVPIHRVGLANYQHCPACPCCGGRPYRIQEARKCFDCRRVAYFHRLAVKQGAIISSYHAQKFVDNPDQSAEVLLPLIFTLLPNQL